MDIKNNIGIKKEVTGSRETAGDPVPKEAAFLKKVTGDRIRSCWIIHKKELPEHGSSDWSICRQDIAMRTPARSLSIP